MNQLRDAEFIWTSEVIPLEQLTAFYGTLNHTHREPTFSFFKRSAVLPIAVFLKQRSTEHRYGFREKYWDKNITILEYRKEV